jgi:hypothetical protein
MIDTPQGVMTRSSRPVFIELIPRPITLGSSDEKCLIQGNVVVLMLACPDNG